MIYKMDGYLNRVPMLTFPIRLDVGAGAYPQEGFVRIDFNVNCGAEIQWDITNGFPLPDDSVSELYTSHCLEHFTRTDYHYILREIFRVCMSGAKVTIKLPHRDTKEGRLPCHYSFFGEDDMQAINDWFPHEGHPDYTGNYFDVQRIWREEPYHLLGEYQIIKGALVR